MSKKRTLGDAFGETRLPKAGMNDLAALLIQEVACPMKPEGEGWQSVQELAAQTGMNENTLRRHLKIWLEEGRAERREFIDPGNRKKAGFWRVKIIE